MALIGIYVSAKACASGDEYKKTALKILVIGSLIFLITIIVLFAIVIIGWTGLYEENFLLNLDTYHSEKKMFFVDHRFCYNVYMAQMYIYSVFHILVIATLICYRESVMRMVG